jgi:hypothetical protein
VSLPDPLTLAGFADTFGIANVKFYPGWQQESSGSGSGQTLYADRGPMLWNVDVTSSELENAVAEAVMALVNSRAGGLKTFLLYNPKLKYPSSDPTGSIFGSATPVVGMIADRFHLAFTGFPAGYVIPAGTYFQIIFDTSRYYLGQFAEAKTADGSGAVSSTEVTPGLPASIAGGEAVTVAKPAAKFRITPNTAYSSTASMVTSSVTFSAKQTYDQ